MKMVTFGPVRTDYSAIRDAVKASLARTEGPPALAIIYPSITIQPEKVVEIIKAEVQVPVVGATTGGAGFTERGIAMDGLVGGFLLGDRLAVKTVAVRNLKDGLADEAKKALASIEPVLQPGHSLFLLADAMACDGEKLIQTVASEVPLHWRLFGGFAGDNWTFQGTKVIHDDQCFSGGAVFTYINDGSLPGVGVRHGFCPIEESPEMTITAIEGNILKSLDGESAVKVYTAELERRGLLQPGGNILPFLAQYPIGMKTLVGEKWKVRTPMAVDGDSLVLAGSIPERSRVRIMSGNTESLLAAAREMISLAAGGLKDRRPSVQLVIDCAGRRQMLGQRYTDQVRAFRVSPECPMLGFTSYGEFARYGGSLEGFHNTTAVAAIW